VAGGTVYISMGTHVHRFFTDKEGNLVTTWTGLTQIRVTMTGETVFLVNSVSANGFNHQCDAGYGYPNE